MKMQMFLQFGTSIIWALLFLFWNAFMVPYGHTFKPFLSLFSSLACREIRVSRDLNERMCISLDTGSMETGSGHRVEASLQPEIQYPVSILRKSISGRHRPVRVADGPMTARCRFT